MNPQELHDRVIKVLGRLEVLDPKGALIALDSIRIVDLISAFEEELSISIPTSFLRGEAFATIPSIETMLGKVLAGAKKP